MKISRLETHDRFQHFTKQSFSISDCCQNLIDKRPFGDHAFYIWVHARTEDNDVSKKRLIWQPRLTKPLAQTNSMLFKGYPGSDKIKIIWMIPEREMWSQFKRGNIVENKIIEESIDKFQNHRALLEAKEDDDLPDETIEVIYRNIIIAAKAKKVIQGDFKI